MRYRRVSRRGHRRTWFQIEELTARIRTELAACGTKLPKIVPLDSPWQEFPQDRVQLVDQAAVVLDQVDAALVQDAQNVGVPFRGDRPEIALAECDARRGGGVDPIVLAPATTGEFAHPGRRGRGLVHDRFTSADEPLGR
ncbi:hypothetical protein R1CP_35940 (plasmid) [Rhodococcus opacus]|uniref:Uncharacterized protein n=1 Tax=Rhodococcus opacus TaxID=37919 RepID=A0A1B1KGR6_RHOOP|nr:hypothetical protein R1CP_35940 [Rhodococcus opacus]